MRIFVDFHHFALARSLLHVFAGRLGHEVYFPDASFSEKYPEALWGVLHDDQQDDFSVYRSTFPGHGTISYEEFADTSFDVIVNSRTESQPVLLALRDEHQPNAKMVAQSGNEGTLYDWDMFPNLMSSDTFTFDRSTSENKVLYSQELGWYFGKEFQPVTEDSQRRVAAYIHGLCGMQRGGFSVDDYNRGICPYCEQGAPRPTNYRVYDYWTQMKEAAPSVSFSLFGSGNDAEDGARCLSEMELVHELKRHSLTWHFKMHEGYGHSICQSVISGRPVIVPKRFFAFRLARRYLIPGVTAFEVDIRRPGHAAEVITELTSDLDHLQRLTRRCYEAAQGLFDWEWEAYEVGRFLERLV